MQSEADVTIFRYLNITTLVQTETTLGGKRSFPQFNVLTLVQTETTLESPDKTLGRRDICYQRQEHLRNRASTSFPYFNVLTLDGILAKQLQAEKGVSDKTEYNNLRVSRQYLRYLNITTLGGRDLGTSAHNIRNQLQRKRLRNIRT